jgi:hypothetical protein
MDPGPIWHQLATFPPLRKLSRRHELAIGQATTHYTEWNG